MPGFAKLSQQELKLKLLNQHPLRQLLDNAIILKVNDSNEENQQIYSVTTSCQSVP